MARPRAARRSRRPARPTAGPVATPPADVPASSARPGLLGAASGPACLTAPVRARAGLCRHLGGVHTADERILAKTLNAGTYKFTRDDMAGKAGRIVGPLPG